MKKIHKLAPCPHYDVERIESWLTDMASEGFHLEKEPIFMGFFPLSKGNPRMSDTGWSRNKPSSTTKSQIRMPRPCMPNMAGNL